MMKPTMLTQQSQVGRGIFFFLNKETRSFLQLIFSLSSDMEGKSKRAGTHIHTNSIIGHICMGSCIYASGFILDMLPRAMQQPPQVNLYADCYKQRGAFLLFLSRLRISPYALLQKQHCDSFPAEFARTGEQRKRARFELKYDLLVAKYNLSHFRPALETRGNDCDCVKMGFGAQERHLKRAPQAPAVFQPVVKHVKNTTKFYPLLLAGFGCMDTAHNDCKSCG